MFYEITIPMSFLSGNSMKIVVKGYSSEAHEIISGIRQGSLLDSTLILLCIKRLHKTFSDNQ